MGLSEDYFDIVRKQCGGMIAMYPPNQPIGLGDYGPIEDGRFTRVGNIVKDFGIALSSVESSQAMSREFSSKGTKRATVGANVVVAAGVVTAKPALSLSFKRDFFRLFRGRRLSNQEHRRRHGNAGRSHKAL